MKNHVYKISENVLRYGRASFLAMSLLVLLPGFAKAQWMSFGVTFGTSQNDGTPCVGKGVCKESLVLDPATGLYANPEAVTATFQISPDNPNVLMMSFLLSELTNKQPEQVAYFTGTVGSYPFDVSYPLAKSAISQLSNLPPNASISTNSASAIVINGDIITDYITLSTN